MFCPSCGTRNSVEQKFCRSCGMNLETSVRSLMEQFPDGARGDLQKQEQRLERFGTIAFGGFGVVILALVGAIIYKVFTELILGGSNVVLGIFAIAFLIFAMLTLAYVVFRESLKEKREKLNPHLHESLPDAHTAKLPDGAGFGPASVTENTTELLPTDAATRKLE